MLSPVSKRAPSPTTSHIPDYAEPGPSSVEHLTIHEEAEHHRDRSLCCPCVQDSVKRSALKNLGLILLWYALSTGLSLYNKQLVGTTSGLFGKGAFPAPLFMSGVQFAVQAAIVRVVLRSGLMDQAPPRVRTWREYCVTGIPNGMCSGLDIGFSTKSLAFISMSFYTMCKSTVPLFLLLFAFVWRIEKPSLELGCVVSVITMGLVLLVRGETHFHVVGFALVMAASCLSGLRFTLTQLLLHGSHEGGTMGSPLEVVELLTPIMSVTVLALSLGWEQLWVTLPASPYFATWQHGGVSALIIVAGATLAFAMVWTEFKVIKETSALTFMMAGTCKEVFTVMAGVLVMGDDLTFVNCVGLVIIIIGVLLYNLYKYRKVKQQGDVAVTPGGRPASGGGTSRREHGISLLSWGSGGVEAGAAQRAMLEDEGDIEDENEPLLPDKIQAVLSF